MAHSDGLFCAAGPREGDQKEIQTDLSHLQSCSASRNGTKRRKRKRTKSKNQETQQTRTKAPKQFRSIEENRTALPARARILEGKQRVSYRTETDSDGHTKRVQQYVYTVNSRRRVNRPRIPSPLRANPTVESTSTVNPEVVRIQSIDDEEIPELHSTEYEFDPDEYRRWHEDHAFTFDACASVINHKCAAYASKDNSFLNHTAADLHGKVLWMFPPIDQAAAFIEHFESIRMQQPLYTAGVIILPRLTTPGAVYKSIVSKYKRIFTYPKGTYLFSRFNADTLQREAAAPTLVEYDLYLADEFALDSPPQSVPAEPTKPTYPSYKPHQARFESAICQVTATSIREDLLVIRTPTDTDPTVQAMVDSGATRYFISDTYVRDKQLSTYPLQQALRVRLADGSMSLARYGVSLAFYIGSSRVTQEFVVTRISGPYQLILGYTFLKQYNPLISWTHGTLTMPDTQEIIQAMIEKRHADIKLVSAKVMSRILKKHNQKKHRLNPVHDPYPDETGLQVYISTIRQILDPDESDCTALNQGVQGYSDDTTTVTEKIDEISTDFGHDMTHKLREILRKYSKPLQPLSGLPKQRPDYDLAIEFDGPIPRAKVYRLSPAELEELATQLKDYLSKGWIRPSSSEYSSSILFAQKPGTNKLRMCTDYRALNRYTRKMMYSLPHIDSLLDRLGHSACFSALDLQSGFHQLRIKDYPNGGMYNSNGEEVRGSDIHKTAFSCQFGTFEYTVMPFGLMNGPSAYQKMVNGLLDPVKRPWLAVYIDDVLIFSENEEEHLEHIKEVMQVFEEHDLHIRQEKCQWMKSSLDYLGFTVQGRTATSPGGIKPNPKKLVAVTEWPVPVSVRAVQSYLGFTNFYRRFIKDYASIAAPLYNLTAKDCPFNWTPECNHAFQLLKQRLTTAPLLVTPRTGLAESFILSTDASNKGIGAVLLQEQSDGTLRPCSYYAKTLNKAQRNYPIYDQEMLAIAAALNEYRVYIEGAASVTVITDHRPLVHLPTQKKVARRHVPWVTAISQYLGYLTIVYRKGEDNDSDALSRREDLMDLTEEHIEKHPELKRKFEEYDAGTFEQELAELRESLSGMTHLQCDDSLTKSIIDGYKYDKAFQGSSLPPGVHQDPKGIYWLADKIFVPNVSSIKSRIIEEFHATAGHPDSERTAAAILRSFYWPHLRKEVKSHVKLCGLCQRIKPRTARPYGSLMPLPVPVRPWESISMDFVTGLPNCDGYDAILTVVCTFSKMAHFIPCTKTVNAKQLAKMVLNEVYRYHGLPRIIISDRDTRITSDFFRNLMADLRTTLCLSTAYHPQSDGNTERTHRTIEQILRSYVHTDHHGWLSSLPLAEFAYNNNVHSSTGYSPFMANYGFDPRTPASLLDPATETPKSTDDILERLMI